MFVSLFFLVLIVFGSQLTPNIIHHTKLPGINLQPNDDQSMIGEVIIVNVTLETEGRIRCEVIVDDTFQVVRHEIDLITIGNLIIVVQHHSSFISIITPNLVPSSSVPQIISKRKSFGIGERVQLICIVGTSKPIASIHWFINDISVPESYYVKINETISNESHLEFILQKVHLTSSGHFIVRCQSQTDAHFYPEGKTLGFKGVNYYY